MALHSSLTGDDLHDVKGADLATEGQVLSADGAGASAFVNPSTLLNIELDDEAIGFSTVNQTPAGLGTALILEFTDTTSTTDVTVDASGTFTFNTAGIYFVNWTANLGRASGAAASKIGYRMQLNGAQYGAVRGLVLDTNALYLPVSFTFLTYFEVGDVLRSQIIQDSSGDASGGARANAFTDWDDLFSVRATAVRIVGS